MTYNSVSRDLVDDPTQRALGEGLLEMVLVLW